MSDLSRNRKRFDAAVSEAGVVEFDFTTLLSLIPAFTQLLSLCKRPVPPNPVQNPTPAQQKAHEWNWHVTSSYVEGKGKYRKPTVTQAAKVVIESGKAKKKADAIPIAVLALDEVRLSDQQTLAEAIEKNGG